MYHYSLAEDGRKEGHWKWWGDVHNSTMILPPLNLIGQAVSFREGIVYRWNEDGCFRFFLENRNMLLEKSGKKTELYNSWSQARNAQIISNNYVPLTINKFREWNRSNIRLTTWDYKTHWCQFAEKSVISAYAFAPWWHRQHHSKPMINENVLKKVQTANLSNSNFIGISLGKS